jgi:drug/metabolite transporter (DMT)-like permease
VEIGVIADESLTREHAAALLVGFAGVLTVLGIWTGLGATSPEGNLLCMGAAVSYGLGFPYARRHLAGGPEGPVSLATGQLICGTLELALITPLLTDPPTAFAAGPIVSVLALGSLGTGVAYILNYSIIRDAGATVASTVTYVIPVFATLAGVVLLGEPLTWNQPVGAAVIVLGSSVGSTSWLVRARPRAGERRYGRRVSGGSTSS